MADSDRRTSQRVESIVVVALDSERHAVTRNASERGLLIATRSRFSPGDRIEVTVYGKSASLRTGARVVRVDETPPTESWRYRVALELDEVLPAELIEEGCAAAAQLK
jgi:hypothetical protein